MIFYQHPYFSIKPKKKTLTSKEDFEQFHRNVRIKKKTELCNNFYFKGKCKFGENVIHHSISISLSVPLHMVRQSSSKSSISMTTLRQNHARTFLRKVIAVMAYDANTSIPKSRTSSNGGGT